jgi:hypothetical protein
VAEGFIIDKELKPILLRSLDPLQFGLIPTSCTTFVLILMLNNWLTEADVTGSVIRVALLDYKKAFYLVDHKLLIAKLLNFLQNRLQRIKISTEGVSDFCMSSWSTTRN